MTFLHVNKNHGPFPMGVGRECKEQEIQSAGIANMHPESVMQ